MSNCGQGNPLSYLLETKKPTCPSATQEKRKLGRKTEFYSIPCQDDILLSLMQLYSKDILETLQFLSIFQLNFLFFHKKKLNINIRAIWSKLNSSMQTEIAFWIQKENWKHIFFLHPNKRNFQFNIHISQLHR